MSEQKYLCVQFQPELARALDVKEVKLLCRGATELSSVVDFEVEEGNDGSDYINFSYKTDCLVEVFEYFREKLFKISFVGPLLCASTIITCEGESGWDDFLLLHHFDRSVSLNTLNP